MLSGKYIVDKGKHMIKRGEGKSTLFYTFDPLRSDMKGIQPGDEINFIFRSVLEVVDILQKAKT